MALQASADEYVKQQHVTTLAVADVRRMRRRGVGAVIGRLTAYQLAAINIAQEVGAEALDEQGIEAPPVGGIEQAALVSGSPAAPLYEKVRGALAFDRLTATMVTNAFSTTATVDMLRRPALTGFVRYLSPPSCSRCAVLAGRFYRYSTAFQRHPRCDCIMRPTTEDVGPSLISDPMVAFREGQITGLSAADAEAIHSGADIGRVINVRRKAAGLSDGSSVIARAGRLTPAGIQRFASDRDDAIALLRRFGYIR